MSVSKSSLKSDLCFTRARDFGDNDGNLLPSPGDFGDNAMHPRPPQQATDHRPFALPPFCFRLPALGKFLMYSRIDDPVRRVGRARPRSSRYPTQRVELFEYCLGFAPRQVAHASVTALDIAVGDALQLVGEDVAGDCGQPVMVVRKPQNPGIEGQSMRQQEAVQEAFNAPCSVLRDDSGYVTLGMFDAMPDHAEPGEDAVVLADMRRQFPVDAFALLKLEVLAFKLLADRQGAIVELQGERQAVRHRLPELVQIADEGVVVEHGLRRAPRRDRSRQGAARSE